MGNLKVIDKEKWQRKEHFKFFSGDVGAPLYGITANLDVTNFYKYTKQHNISFYYSLIWATTEIMNKIENFRYKIRGEDVVLLERLIPAFTDLKADSELFHIVVLDLQVDMIGFARSAKMVSSEQQEYFSASLDNYDEDSLIQFSCLPWFAFTSISPENNGNHDDSTPTVTWGKYEQVADKLQLPYYVRVNHRLVDGIHIGKLFNMLQSYMDSLSLE